MKQKFSALDVCAIVHDLRNELAGLRLQNIYDINPKTFLLKFTSPTNKQLLLIESGTRMHTTTYTRDKNNTPSAFCALLRKHVKTRRLISITQLGMDRVVDYQLGEGEFAFHLIVELYALGNVILCDNKYKIIALLRRVTVEQADNQQGEMEDIKFAIGETYSFALVKQHSAITLGSLTTDLESIQSIEQEQVKKKDASIRKLLRQAVGYIYGPALIDHALTAQCISLTLKMSKQVLLADGEMMQRAVNGLAVADAIIVDCITTGRPGFILAQEFIASNQLTALDESTSTIHTFEEFHPFAFQHLLSSPTLSLLPYLTFNEAVDTFYSSFESQKILKKQHQAEQTAFAKLESVRQSHKKQLDLFDIQRTLSQRMASVIEENSQVVDNVLEVVRGLLGSGMDWKELWMVVQEEHAKGNPLAMFIVGLKLDVGIVTLQLPIQALCDEDQENTLQVDIDIYKSAHANARTHHKSKKVSQTKHAKTSTISEQVFAQAKQKIETQLKKTTQQIPLLVAKARVHFWFERFNCDENYLCISPKDPAQTPQLERYILASDVVVTADYPGAPLVLVKSPHSSPSPSLDRAIEDDLVAESAVVGEPTLLQAAQMSACLSKSWETKSSTTASWINTSQATSSSPFKYVGPSNTIPQVPLIYGFAVLFAVDGSDIDGHLGERRPWNRTARADGKYSERYIADQMMKDEILTVVANDETEAVAGKDLKVIAASVREDIKENESENVIESDEEFPDTQFDDDTIPLDTLRLSDQPQSLSVSLHVSPSVPLSVQRGKKAKQKKRSKYRDQDDSDREAMQILLAPDRGPQPKGKRAKQAAVNAEILRAKIADSDKKKQEKAAHAPPLNNQPVLLKPLFKEAFDWTVLDRLTGQPLSSDNLVSAVIVSGPWQALQRYTYKQKIIPGSTKRSKAVSTAVSKFLEQASRNGRERELELIKSIPECELIAAMLGKVKLV